MGYPKLLTWQRQPRTNARERRGPGPGQIEVREVLELTPACFFVLSSGEHAHFFVA